MYICGMAWFKILRFMLCHILSGQIPLVKILTFKQVSSILKPFAPKTTQKTGFVGFFDHFRNSYNFN